MSIMTGGLIKSLSKQEIIKIDWDEYLWGNIKTEYPRLAQVIELRFGHLHGYDKSDIASIVLGICGSCHNNDSKCQCWNDE